MEFKFSCQWFEIAFSGDPGFVEAQIAKYEPFILGVLKRMETEAVQAPRVEPRPTEARAAAEPEPGPDRPPRGGNPHYWDRWRKEEDNRPERQRSAPHPDRPPAGPRGGHHPPRARAEQGAAAPNLAPQDPVPEPRRESPRDQANVNPAPANGRKPAEPETGPGREFPSSHPTPPPAAASSSEFIPRRRAPRIQTEDLVRIVEEKKPRTHHDRVMVFGYFMENDGEGSDFNVAEIKRCYRAVNQDPGNNIEQVILHATRSGFINRFDEGRTARFRLSSKGRRYVQDGLKLS